MIKVAVVHILKIQKRVSRMITEFNYQKRSKGAAQEISKGLVLSLTKHKDRPQSGTPSFRLKHFTYEKSKRKAT